MADARVQRAKMIGAGSGRRQAAVSPSGPDVVRVLLTTADQWRPARIRAALAIAGRRTHDIMVVPSLHRALNLLRRQVFDVWLIDGALLEDGWGARVAESVSTAGAPPMLVLSDEVSNAPESEIVDLASVDIVMHALANPGILDQAIHYALEHAQLETQLAHQSFHDPLTGLPNRHLALDRLAMALARLDGSSDTIAVVCIGLDRFTRINAGFGYEAGDRVLAEAARRIASALRPQDTLCRFAGDEFIVVLEGLRHPHDAVMFGRRLVASLQEPVHPVSDEPVRLGATAGVATAALPSCRPEDLVRDAGAAMRRAKVSRRGSIGIADAQARSWTAERVRMESQLQHDLERDRLRLHYQPLVDLDSRTPYGFEALLRWRAPDGRWVPPSVFVPVAEETGLIVPMGSWVIRSACAYAGQVASEAPKAPLISVNISPVQLSDPGLVETFERELRANQLPADSLGVEVTENTLIRDGDQAREVLGALRELGVSVAMDDFGTGYASLTHLKDYPIDVVKIDRSFVSNLAENAGDRAIVRAMTALSHELGLTVVAEGVEREEQVEILASIGCDGAQGFFFEGAHVDPALQVEMLGA